ncbi:unnamed protein product, partial [Mesorhabditis spiculigera]
MERMQNFMAQFHDRFPHIGLQNQNSIFLSNKPVLDLVSGLPNKIPHDNAASYGDLSNQNIIVIANKGKSSWRSSTTVFFTKDCKIKSRRPGTNRDRQRAMALFRYTKTSVHQFSNQVLGK